MESRAIQLIDRESVAKKLRAIGVQRTCGLLQDDPMTIPDLRLDVHPEACAMAVRFIPATFAESQESGWRIHSVQVSAVIREIVEKCCVGEAGTELLIVPQHPTACQFENAGKKWYQDLNNLQPIDKRLVESIRSKASPDSESCFAALEMCWGVLKSFLDRLAYIIWWGQGSPFSIVISGLPAVMFLAEYRLLIHFATRTMRDQAADAVRTLVSPENLNSWQGSIMNWSRRGK